MTANPKDSTENKGLLQKIKEKVDDREEQFAILSTFVRLGILVWSGSILTLAYIKLPAFLKIPEQKLDPTFIASVFTGTLATFGVQATQKKNGTNGKSNEQVIVIKQAPLIIKPEGYEKTN
jgi:hypothetical protein